MYRSGNSFNIKKICTKQASLLIAKAKFVELIGQNIHSSILQIQMTS